ncbi:hypothetical protein FBU59_006441, partial [Linderina macrospora]
MSLLIEARIHEGFVIKSVQVAKLNRNGAVERINVKMELVWHPNITVIYRITNTHKIGQAGGGSMAGILPNMQPATETAGADRNGNDSDAQSSSGFDDDDDGDDSEHGTSASIDDRGQRGPNMVDIMIRSYSLFRVAFLRHGQDGSRKGEIYAKANMLIEFLKSIHSKDMQLRQIYGLSSIALPSDTISAQRSALVKSLPTVPVQASPTITPMAPPIHPPPQYAMPRTTKEKWSSGTRVITDGVDLSVFMGFKDWTQQHQQMYEVMRQMYKTSESVSLLCGFEYITSLFIEPDLISPHIYGVNFKEASKRGRQILRDFRAHVCNSGTWALLKDKDVSIVFLRDRYRLSLGSPVFAIVRWQMVTDWVMRVSFNIFNGTV